MEGISRGIHAAKCAHIILRRNARHNYTAMLSAPTELSHPSTHSSPSSAYSFFQIGTVVLSVSIA
jgi:hypothetical protein